MKTAAYPLAPNLSWPKTLLTGLTPRAGVATCLEARRKVVSERVNTIATPDKDARSEENVRKMKPKAAMSRDNCHERSNPRTKN